MSIAEAMDEARWKLADVLRQHGLIMQGLYYSDDERGDDKREPHYEIHCVRAAENLVAEGHPDPEHPDNVTVYDIEGRALGTWTRRRIAPIPKSDS